MTTSTLHGNPGHDQDLVAVFRSDKHDSEMEAMSIHSLLDANGIESIVVGPATLPVVEFQVQVSAARLADAQRVIAEAEASGPTAADEAEAAGERAIDL